MIKTIYGEKLYQKTFKNILCTTTKTPRQGGCKDRNSYLNKQKIFQFENLNIKSTGINSGKPIEKPQFLRNF